jgi:hypothetical protein
MDEKISKQEEIESLVKIIEDLQNRLPAHSVKPKMLQELEELQEKLESLMHEHE